MLILVLVFNITARDVIFLSSVDTRVQTLTVSLCM